MSKLIEFQRLLDSYVDVFGRVTYLHSSKSNPTIYKYDSLNQNLWTGQANILLTLIPELQNEKFYAEMLANTKKSLDATRIVPGLYSRQPAPYSTLPTDYHEAKKLGHSAPYDAISLDEYNGIAFSIATYPSYDLKKQCEDIIDYARKNEWCFYDKYPNLNPYDVAWANKPGFFKNMYNIIKSAFTSKDFTGSNQMDKIIDANLATTLFTHILQPKDRLILKLASRGYSKPNLLDWLNFALATLATCKDSNDERSGKILAFYRFKLIELQDAENFLSKYVKKVFHKRLMRKYGEEYLRVIFWNYYEDRNHPFHKLIIGLDVNSKPLFRS